MKKSAKILLGLTAAAAGAGALFCVTGEVLYRLILDEKAIKSSKLLKEDKEFDELFNTNHLTVEGQEWFKAYPHDNREIISRRGERLHAFYLVPEKPSDIYIICAHGYAVAPESNSAQAKKFIENGYNVLMPSLGGHGESESKYVSMGWHDRLDLCDWIDSICAENPKAKIVLYGISMGGAAVMMTVGESLPSNVVCAIEDCGYTSVLDEFNAAINDALHLPSFPFIPAADLMTRLHAGYSFAEASSIEQLKKAKIPMLFIHGSADTFVPARMVDECYDAAPCEKEKLVVEGAIHGCSGLVEPEKYFDTINAFIQKYLGETE